MKLEDITIDPEFASLLPPLPNCDRWRLAESVENDGFNDKLIVWLGHGILVDGHNRFDIWKQELEGGEIAAPEIEEKYFADRDAVKEFMLNRQLARRNLTDAQRVQIALQLESFTQAQAKANLSAAGRSASPGKPSTTLSKVIEPVNVRKEVAAKSGISEGTVSKVKKVLADGTDEVRRAMLAPKDDDSHISISAAHRTLASAPDRRVAPNRQRDDSGPSKVGVRKAKEAIKILREIPPDDLKIHDAIKAVGSWMSGYMPDYHRKFMCGATARDYAMSAYHHLLLSGANDQKIAEAIELIGGFLEDAYPSTAEATVEDQSVTQAV